MEPSSNSDCIHVVIGIIKNTKNEVLVTRRKENAHLAGLLEFPGGKVDVGESPKQALVRELKEELNITIQQFSHLIQIPYTYSDRKVFLDVYNIDQYTGTIFTNESQEIDWQDIINLNFSAFPSANRGIIRALQLPKIIAVTPNYDQNAESFLCEFENTIKNKNLSIIHFRSHALSNDEYIRLSKDCFRLCSQSNTKLILNRGQNCVKRVHAAGLHLTSKRLLATEQRPLNREYLVSASCHTIAEVKHANSLDLDYVFLGPVVEKHMSVESNPLGWEQFARITRESKIPVYAIGGLTVADVATAIESGGQGIAAIRDLWAS